MKRSVILISTFFAICFATLSVSAQTDYTPAKGSAERTAILNGVRKYRKVPSEVYTPRNFKVQNGWAFVSADDPNEPGVDTLAFDVLLQKSGNNWKVVAEVSHDEGTNFEKEIKRIRKKFPKAAASIFP